MQLARQRAKRMHGCKAEFYANRSPKSSSARIVMGKVPWVTVAMWARVNDVNEPMSSMVFRKFATILASKQVLIV